MLTQAKVASPDRYLTQDFVTSVTNLSSGTETNAIRLLGYLNIFSSISLSNHSIHFFSSFNTNDHIGLAGIVIIPLHQVFLGDFEPLSLGSTTAKKYLLCFSVIFRWAQTSCIFASHSISVYISTFHFQTLLYFTEFLSFQELSRGLQGELILSFHQGCFTPYLALTLFLTYIQTLFIPSVSNCCNSLADSFK